MRRTSRPPPKKEPQKKERERLPTNYIDLKRQKQQLSLHHVARRGTYMMDLMFDGPKNSNKMECYMVAINVNTRKAFAISTKTEVGDHFEYKSAWALTTALEGIKTLINTSPGAELNQLEYIIMDGEKGMYSQDVRQWLEVNSIKIRRVDIKEIHTALSLIDRLIRTLRDMNYKENNGPGRLIDEHIMNHLVEKYNKSVHLGLSKLIGFDVSPNNVHENIDLQMKVIKRLEQKNFLVYTDRRFTFDKGMRVVIWDPPKWNVKRRLRLKPDGYIVNEMKGGYYELINETDGKKVLYPRWGMKAEV